MLHSKPLNYCKVFRLPALFVLCFTCALAAAFVYSSMPIGEVQAAPTKAKRHKRPRVKAPKPEEDEQVSSEPLGTLEADLPLRAQKDQPFDIDIWLQPKDKDKKFDAEVWVFMEQTSQVKYEPRAFQVLPGANDRVTIKATILNPTGGLASIEGTAEDWESLSTIVDTGFTAKLKTNIIEPIDSGQGKSFIINLVDSLGNPVSLDTDIDVILRSSNIKLWDQKNKSWQEEVVLKMEQGTNSSPPLTIQSDSLIADKALISATLKSQERLFHNADFGIDIKARWYVPLLLAMFGGILHGVYKIVKESHDPSNRLHPGGVGAILVGLFTGAIAGSLAYLLISWGVLGIKVETTTLQAFVILGFLFSYVGVDFILKTVTSKAGIREPQTATTPNTASPNEVV
jgi:hypothetical protein